MSEELSQSSSQSTQLELARLRTALACDRTLLAWIRTSLTLLAFGFSLVKFLHALVEKGVLKDLQLGSPRTVGLTMMLLGVIGLTAGAIEQWRSVKKLGAVSTWSTALILAIVLAIVSLLLTLGLAIETIGY